MSFESISPQLMAATNKPCLTNMLANEIPPPSADNKSPSGQYSLLHSHVNTTSTNATANSNPQTSEDDLIVLDTLKANKVVKMKQG